MRYTGVGGVSEWGLGINILYFTC